MTDRLKNTAQRLGLVMLALTTFSTVSFAQAIAPSPCDPKYYDSMEARAYLEAQREITQNQNLILKPDSVLEYTCFNQFMNVLANSASGMFSETNRWQTPPPGNMGSTLNALIGGAYSSYIPGNFGHTVLGDRGTNVTGSGGGYNCNVMNEVWKQAKCMNFFDEPDQDGFYTLAEYATGDDRRRKPGPTCPGPTGALDWQKQIDKAFADETKTPWLEDDVNAFFEEMNESNCTDSVKIRTGVKVRRTTAPQEYNEFICLAPGCYYKPSGMNQGTCENAN